jgi:hypothetical protein
MSEDSTTESVLEEYIDTIALPQVSSADQDDNISPNISSTPEGEASKKEAKLEEQPVTETKPSEPRTTD